MRLGTRLILDKKSKLYDAASIAILPIPDLSNLYEKIKSGSSYYIILGINSVNAYCLLI